MTFAKNSWLVWFPLITSATAHNDSVKTSAGTPLDIKISQRACNNLHASIFRWQAATNCKKKFPPSINIEKIVVPFFLLIFYYLFYFWACYLSSGYFRKNCPITWAGPFGATKARITWTIQWRFETFCGLQLAKGLSSTSGGISNKGFSLWI